MHLQFWESGGRTLQKLSSLVEGVWASAWPITWPKLG